MEATPSAIPQQIIINATAPLVQDATQSGISTLVSRMELFIGILGAFGGIFLGVIAIMLVIIGYLIWENNKAKNRMNKALEQIEKDVIRARNSRIVISKVETEIKTINQELMSKVSKGEVKLTKAGTKKILNRIQAVEQRLGEINELKLISPAVIYGGDDNNSVHILGSNQKSYPAVGSVTIHPAELQSLSQSIEDLRGTVINASPSASAYKSPHSHITPGHSHSHSVTATPKFEMETGENKTQK